MGVVSKRCSIFPVHAHPGTDARRSHDAVCEILESVIELGSDGTHGAVHHLLHQHLQLLFRQVHVESLFQVTDGAGAVKAGELRTCRKQEAVL